MLCLELRTNGLRIGKVLGVLCGFVLILVPSAWAQQSEKSFARPSEFYVIAQADTLLRGRDIESYNRSTRILLLTFDGYYQWTRYVRPLVVDGKSSSDRTILSERPFRIEYRGETLVEGHIRSGRNCDLYSGVTLFDSEKENFRGRLSLRYWKFAPGMGSSPLETDAFLEYFIDSGKLVDWLIRW